MWYMFFAILSIWIVIIGVFYAFKTLIVGLKEIKRTEKEKKEGNEAFWAVSTIIGFMIFGIGVIIPIIHAKINKKEDEYKKLLKYLIISLTGVVLGLASFLFFTYGILETIFFWAVD